MLPIAVCLMGPTASGKTGIAVELVQRLPMEIISVDSALVYRGMDVGTAKPDAATLKYAPHRLINIRDPEQAYSAAEFRDDALLEMRAITSRGRIPLLVGGTMLYFRALERGLSDLPRADPEVRASLEAQARDKGRAYLHARLAQVDPESAARIHPNDPQRTQRALEVYEITGVPLSRWYREPMHGAAPYRFVKLALWIEDRAQLHARISQRFAKMLQDGFLEEVRSLRKRPCLQADMPSMRAVGYRQAWEYLDGRVQESEWQARALSATRQYAKRQLTWLRSESQTLRVDPLDAGALGQVESLLARAGATTTT